MEAAQEGVGFLAGLFVTASFLPLLHQHCSASGPRRGGVRARGFEAAFLVGALLWVAYGTLQRLSAPPQAHWLVGLPLVATNCVNGALGALALLRAPRAPNRGEVGGG
jgi:uncharacterized protein with PQ loop repeat